MRKIVYPAFVKEELLKSLSKWSAESIKIPSFGFYIAVQSCWPLIA
jgi:hypothetical protein